MALKPFRVLGPDGKAVEAWLREHEPKQSVRSLDDALELGDISCMDADGNVFEQYRRLHVGKDILRNANGSQQNFTPYDAAVYCEEKGMFEPSFALSCNILAALWKYKSDTAADSVLMQYKDKGNGHGWHAQNTLIDFGRSEVIHYPTAGDFKKKCVVNAKRRRTTLSFDKSQLCDSPLEDALRNDSVREYVRQLTGLKEPDVLVDIGKYFGKPAHFWFPWTGRNGSGCSETKPAWLCCSYDGFDLVAYDSLTLTSPFVGYVRAIASEGAP